jgi:lipopolysaccharide heptosyltransferase II
MRSLPASPSMLVVLMGSLGDIARALPLVSLLKEQRPAARISWLVDWRWHDLVVSHPAVDRTLVFPRERTAAAMSRLARDLRSEPYDVVLDLQRHLKSGICSRLSGARRRIGFHRKNAKEFNHLFNSERIAWRPADTSKLRHYLAFAEHLGLRIPDVLDFGLGWLGDAGHRPAAVRAIETAFVGIVMGSSWRTKDWTTQGYRDLTSLIRSETPHHVVLLGDRSQLPVAEHVVQAGGPQRILNLVGQTSLIELGATLASARAVTGPDSGPGHLCAALGTPYVALFGPTDPARVAPYRNEHLVVRSPVDCLPCGRRRCRRKAGPCMDAISAGVVWERLRPLLSA